MLVGLLDQIIRPNGSRKPTRYDLRACVVKKSHLLFSLILVTSSAFYF